MRVRTLPHTHATKQPHPPTQNKPTRTKTHSPTHTHPHKSIYLSINTKRVIKIQCNLCTYEGKTHRDTRKLLVVKVKV